MKRIDYPSDFEAMVSAALAHPCLLDLRGNLHMLRGDCATVFVAGPETPSDVQFQGAGSGPELSWAASQERLFVRFNKGAETIQATLPATDSSGYIPTYRRTTLAVTSPVSAFLVHNTPETLYCFAVAPDGVRLCAKIDRHKGFGAWRTGDNLYIFGMRTRVRKIFKPWFSKGEFFSLKYGVGTLSRIALPSGRVVTHRAKNTKKELVKAWETAVGNTEKRYVRPLLEVWLDSVETAWGRILIGGVMDKRVPEFDDTSEEPFHREFAGIALYRWDEEEKVELLRLLPGVGYVGKIAGPRRPLLYFLKDADPRSATDDQFVALPISEGMQSALLPLTFDWASVNRPGFRGGRLV